MVVVLWMCPASVVVVACCSCCLFLLFVLRSLACTHNDRDEWIVFCCWHFGGRAGSLTFLSHTIQNVSKIVRLSLGLSVCLSVTCLRRHFSVLAVSFWILSDLPTTLARSLTRDRMGTRCKFPNRRRRGYNRKEQITAPTLSYCLTDTTSASERSTKCIHWSD